ncbi:SIMPL domain-containing protein [Aurantiacibacter gangjinensis]|uniref:Uncharacterized protein n=1 Tax=Aurantiacibacter gangjinensis TaxID=502682 RepID=A0A0G9MRH7_9SPHN|nr:SIMPL domain-containing protein [Aurantiacibacter gangjinensis]APE29057.1 Protein of unknown function DUF541 [Aurantiacibacter gangjinensis]KLE33149.1 hypothetical protein AAW01_04000 [Aurantiacibacter gangjinensis]
MLRYALPAIAAAAFSQPALADVEIISEGPVIALSITETVNQAPDIANLSAGVTTLEPTAVGAMQANARQMERVIERLERLGIDRDDIQTSGINLNAEYRWEGPENRQIFNGYRVMNRVSVTLREIDRAGEVLDALVAAGATDIGGIGWAVEDDSAAREQARSAAFATGMERARAYAQMAGYGNVRLLEVSEVVGPGRPMVMTEQIVVTAAARADVQTPVRPGQVQSGVTVTFTYEMTR